MMWVALDPRFTPDMLGYIPEFISDDDPRPAREQLDENYRHGGGWRPLEGWTLDPKTLVLRYPGDPSMKPLAITALRDEKIVFYPHEQVMILQPDGSFEVSRMN